MTRLYVRPIDPDAEGTFDTYIEMLEIIASMEEARDAGNFREQVRVMKSARRMIEMLATTDDGTPIEEAITRLSMSEAMAVIRGVVPEPTVDPQPATSSPSSSGELVATSRAGSRST